MNLGRKLAMLLKSSGMSQARLARAGGFHPTQVSRWVNGEGSPSLSQALSLAKAFGVSLDYLADDSLDDPPKADDLTDDEKFILRLIRSTKVDPDRTIAEILRLSHLMEQERDEEEAYSKENEQSAEEAEANSGLPAEGYVIPDVVVPDNSAFFVELWLNEWKKSPNQLKFKPAFYTRYLDELRAISREINPSTLAEVAKIMERLAFETSHPRGKDDRSGGLKARDRAARLAEQIEEVARRFIRE